MMGRRMGLASVIAISLMAFGSGLAAHGSGLASGEFMQSRIVSNNGLYHLDNQGDGNLVVYDATGTPIWASGTWGNHGAFLVLADNGMLSVVSADGSITLWTTDSYIGG